MQIRVGGGGVRLGVRVKYGFELGVRVRVRVGVRFRARVRVRHLGRDAPTFQSPATLYCRITRVQLVSENEGTLILFCK